jgi:hypothetical protein
MKTMRATGREHSNPKTTTIYAESNRHPLDVCTAQMPSVSTIVKKNSKIIPADACAAGHFSKTQKTEWTTATETNDQLTMAYTVSIDGKMH